MVDIIEHDLENIVTVIFASMFLQLWIKPEGKQLCTAFKKLRKLSLHGIFVEFDLLWMIVLLEAAPSVEIFDIEVLLFVCFLFIKCFSLQ
jgi:hypothetical protein